MGFPLNSELSITEVIMSSSKATPNAELRLKMRRRRDALSAKHQVQASFKLSNSARRSPRLLNANRLAAYLAFEGEIQPHQLIKRLTSAQLFLPRISNYQRREMRFLRADGARQLSRFGISEPLPITQPTPANMLDVILLPVVAFDRRGNRLGMGAGYYDRVLSSLAHQSSTRPYLVGLAHHFQEVKSLQASPWDVPLDAILTDLEFIQVTR